MSAMEKMLASMMGITPEEMQETAKTVIDLARNGAEALEKLQKDVSAIKAYLMPEIIEGNIVTSQLEDKSDAKRN